VLVCALGADAQTATLLKDINTTEDVSYSSEPLDLVEWNGAAYFFASSGPNVQGLWRTDGTAAGTRLVKEHIDGRHLTAGGSKLFFIGNDGSHGSELWTTDGTAAGTTLVKDIGVGLVDGVSPNRGLFAVGGTAYFVAGDFDADLTLWKSDGTEAGTVSLLAVDPEAPSSIGVLDGADGLTYLYANDGVNGSELWKTDGTLAGTVLVRDIRPGPEGSYPQGVALLNGSMFFFADDGLHGFELWKSDGSTIGTSLVADLNPGAEGAWSSDFFSRLLAGNRLYFAADNGDGTGVGLWKSDGTAAGTERIISGVEPQDLVSAGNLVYFIVGDGSDTPSVLWKTDGTTAGTAPVREFDSIDSFLGRFGGSLFFAATDGEQGSQLWKTNGALAGTVLVKQINAAGSSHPRDAAVVRDNAFVSDTLVFRADDGIHGGELWKTNGSGAGTTLVKDIGVSAGSSNPAEFVLRGDELYFTAVGDPGERTQWKTNGTVEGTVTTDEGPRLSEPRFYAFDDGVHGRELWKTDGTEAGTALLKDINPGPADGVVEEPEMVLTGETLFFPADDGLHGLELWKSDGSAAGTVMVRNIHAATGIGSDPRAFTDLNGILMFFAASGQSSNELWRSDGTEAGTVLVQDLRLKAPTGALFADRVVSNNLLFFIAAGPQTGYDLWRTDGTADGTLFLKDLNGFLFQPTPQIADLGGTLLFTTQQITPLSSGSASHATLWTSDGTVDGTRLLKAFDPAPDENTPISPFTNYLGALYFTVQAPTGQRELWKSDATESGTVMAIDLPGDAMSVDGILGSYAGSLFLSVKDGAGEQALLHIARTQGTTETTVIGDQGFLGIGLSKGVGSNVFFEGITEETGNELWALPLLPAISANGVVDAAGYLPTLAPGGLASLFGVELAGETAAASGFPLPTTLGGARVQVNGVDAPLLFVSPTQINFQVPYGTPLGVGVSVIASLNGQQSVSEPTAVAEFAPALFVNPDTGEPIVQRHADGSLITAQNPAKPGDTLVLYVTGIGGLDNPPSTGAAASDSPLAMSTVLPTVSVGGIEATVLFAGLAPDFAGLGQINIQLPAALAQGTPLPLTIRFGDSASPTLELPF
jgi:uncharacterized protein (TIGR03437 family)